MVDYGSAMTTQSTKVYALTKELAAYPVQAFDAYLTKIEPLNGNWSKDAVQHFVQMVDEKFLYARFRELQVCQSILIFIRLKLLAINAIQS